MKGEYKPDESSRARIIYINSVLPHNHCTPICKRFILSLFLAPCWKEISIRILTPTSDLSNKIIEELAIGTNKSSSTKRVFTVTVFQYLKTFGIRSNYIENIRHKIDWKESLFTWQLMYQISR